MVSSRKQANVERTVEQLKAENLNVEGIVCHVGKSEHRNNLIKEVSIYLGAYKPNCCLQGIFCPSLGAKFPK